MSVRTKPIGYAVVGAGIWGTLHLNTMVPDPRIRMLAVCDVDEQRAREAAQKYKIPNVYTSHEEMLKNQDIEAVSIATPDFAHGAAALAAAQAGKHLIVEKPMATTSEECLAIIEASSRSGSTLMVDMHNRWNPPYFDAYSSLRSGEMGDLHYVYFRLNDSMYVPLHYISWAHRSTVLWFLGPHSTDTVRWLFDDEVREVYCVRRAGVLQAQGVDTPDFYVLTLQFEKGGVAVLEHAWIESPYAGNIFDQKCEMLASQGTVFIDSSHNRYYEKYTDRSPQGYPHHPMQDMVVTPVVQGRQVGFGAESIRYFADCLWEKKQPSVTGIDGLRATEIIEAAERSAQTGRPEIVVRHTV